MKIYLFSFLLCCTSIPLFAQSQRTDQVKSTITVDRVSFMDDVVNQYFEKAKDYAAIYNTKVQTTYPKNVIDNPYFLDISEYTKGDVSFDGVIYPEVDLRWDLYKDEIQILSADGKRHLVLQKNKIDVVYMLSYRIYYISSKNIKNSFNAGYYISLYDGNEYKVLRKPICKISDNTQATVEIRFKKSTKYYIFKDDANYEVKNKKSVLNVFGTHKKVLEQFIRHENLNFKRNFENATISVVKQYELLTNQEL